MFAAHFASHRIAWTRVLALTVLTLVLFTRPPALSPSWLMDVSELLGFALLVVGCLWRIWTALFIAGTKNGALAVSGPYSVVRNPLYLGNLAGLIGFGFAVEQPFVALALGAAFAVFYPSVVAQEEARLSALFGETYREYCARVPRWLPDWSLYREPETVNVSPLGMRGAILDAMWFLWAFGVWEFIEELHKLELIPKLF